MVNAHFLPPIEPYEHGVLAVDAPHRLYWEQVGNPEGAPVLFFHGGPGAGCSVNDRRFFDPAAFRVVLFDQRGCGRSTPRGELAGNDPDALVRDAEALREHLGIETWHVFGGSWGSTLSLHYAQTHPERTRSLTLRGIWLIREAEIRWWLYEMGWIQPELWDAFVDPIPAAERGDLLEAYWKRLDGADRAEALRCAQAWSLYEGACCTLLPNDEFRSSFADPDLAWSLARLEAHYFRNVRFRPDGVLLERMDRLQGIPAFAVHGRYDIVCPVRNLFDLQARWPELDAVVVPDAGHSSHEPGITKELVAAMHRVARTGSPRRS